MMRMRRRTKRAEEVLNHLVKTLTTDRVYQTYDYKSRDESYIRQALYEALRLGIRDFYKRKTPHYSKSTLDRKARRALTWEGDARTSIRGTELFARSHRPDYVVDMENLRIAIEVKSGDSGSGIRNGLGQALVYSTDYDFVIYLMIDTSRDSAIANSANNDPERSLIERLWFSHNIRMVLV